MSSFNNMDNVPVKISEKYKPPPRLFQLPQAIANKLMLPPNHYYESPQFSYDFQLEKKVLSKISEWRQVRQAAREARRERKEQREQQQLRKIETHHKELLGAVSYPSTDDLSSTESDEEVCVTEEMGTDTNDKRIMNSARTAANTHINSFHNILQPTILSRNLENTPSTVENTNLSTAHADNVINAGKPLNAFNYKDFEDDTSSPFDNIELKTINDLDILAQVLNNTQMNAERKSTIDDTSSVELQETKDDNRDVNEHVENFNLINSAKTSDRLTTIDLDNSQAVASNNINYDQLVSQVQCTENIPNITNPLQHVPNNYMFQASRCAPFPTSIQPTYMPYNNHILNGLDQHYANYNLQTQGLNNQKYLYHTQCNDGDMNGTSSAAYYSPTHAQMYQGANVKSYLKPHSNANNSATEFSSPQNHPSPAELIECALSLKSKSVPDILKELRDEVKNSEMRRSRNYSHTLDDSKQTAEGENSGIVNNSINGEDEPCNNTKEYYSSLEASTQKLAKNISSMGFPLERVAKIAQLFGADDKKIVEHLIPLSELMDLGFDETKISEALLKFDNNKEKALEYLIS